MTRAAGLPLFADTVDGPGLILPAETVTDAQAILGRRGSGKTYAALQLAERMLEGGHQVAAIDPTGVWWGLRSNAAGDGPGFGVVVLGGDEQDVPLEPTAGELIADLLVDTATSIVLDLSHMRKADRTRFLTAFAERLYHRKGPRKHRTPLHLFVDEAHTFVPQRPQPDQARMLGAGEDIVQLGRSRGLGVTLISQRPAVVNKNVLAQVAGLICLQLTAPQDRKALDAWLEEVDPEQRRAFLADLPALGRGEAVAWFPTRGIFARGTTRGRTTFDSSATPDVGARVVVPTGRADVDLDALTEAMAETVERHKANDPNVLRHRLAEAEERAARLAETRDQCQAIIARLEEELLERPTLTEQVPVLPPGLIDRICGDVAGIEETVTTSVEVAVASTLEAIRLSVSESPHTTPDPAPVPPPPPEPRRTGRDRPAVTVATTPAPAPVDPGDYVPTAGAARALEALCRWHPGSMTEAMVAQAADMKRTGGAWQGHWSDLRKHGLVVMAGQALGSGTRFEASASGFAALGLTPDAAPLTRSGLIGLWRPKLPAGAQRILDAVVDTFPQRLTRGELADVVNMTASGGAFQSALSKVRDTGLVDVEGQMVGMSGFYAEAGA